MSFNFMAAITICSDFGAQKNKDGKPKNGLNVPVGTENLDSRLWVREEWETL